jgi:site-specific DNA recombinase
MTAEMTAELAGQKIPAAFGGRRDRTVIYVRISDARNGTGRDISEQGIDRQEAQGRTLAKSLGWRVLAVIADNDRSAYKRARVRLPDGTTGLRVDRPGFREVLRLLASGAADSLIAIDLDRTARDPRDLEDLIDVVESRTPRVPVRSVSGSLRLENDADITMARVMVAIANKSSRDTARRVRDARMDSASKGSYGGGSLRPYGWAINRDGADSGLRGTLTLIPEEAAVIADVATRFLKGESLASIARDLNRRGLSTVTGVPWTAPTLTAILRRPRNVGRSMHGFETRADGKPDKLKPVIVGEGQWAPVLDIDTYESIVAILNDPARRNPKGNRPKYLGTNIFGCAICDAAGRPARVLVKLARGVPSYTCSGGGTDHLSRRLDKVNELVIAVVCGILARPDAAFLFAPAPKGPPPAGEGYADLVSRASAIRQAMASQAAMHAVGDLTDAEFKSGRAAATARLAEIERATSVVSVVNPFAEIAGRENARALWDGLPLDRQRAIVRALVKVTLCPVGKKTAGRFDPEAVRIEPLES